MSFMLASSRPASEKFQFAAFVTDAAVLVTPPVVPWPPSFFTAPLALTPTFAASVPKGMEIGAFWNVGAGVCGLAVEEALVSGIAGFRGGEALLHL